MDANAPAGIVSARVDAVIVRANGAREDLGTIAFWHRRALRRFGYALGTLGNRRRAPGFGARLSQSFWPWST